MTKLIKSFLVALAIVGISQNMAQAKTGKPAYSVNGQVTSRDTGNSVQHNSQIRLVQSTRPRVSPSAALRAAKRVAPGSKGLGVRFMPRQRGYVVTLKTRGRIRRVFVDGRTGRVGR